MTALKFLSHQHSSSRPSAQAQLNGRDVLVCIFQRGAADGLNSIVPYGDSQYAVQRPNTRVPDPGESGGGIDLDGFFAMHPALAPLKPIYDAGDLACVHATGFPHGSRSHFSAQGLMERGVIDSAGPDTGWLGRFMSLLPDNPDTAFRSVAISGNVPVALTGSVEPIAVSNLSDFGFDQGIIDSGYTEILANLFRSGSAYSSAAQASLAAIGELQRANLPAIPVENGAIYPASALGGKLAQVAKLIKSSIPVEFICVDSDGWDHHEQLPVYINQSLAEMSLALQAFYNDLGTSMNSVTVLVYTEFGRRVYENGSQGADHGTGGLAYLMGGGVNGGQVVSDWPGLADANLVDGDLKITSDLRGVLLEMLKMRLGGGGLDLSSVFPGYDDDPAFNLFNSM